MREDVDKGSSEHRRVCAIFRAKEICAFFVSANGEQGSVAVHFDLKRIEKEKKNEWEKEGEKETEKEGVKWLKKR